MIKFLNRFCSNINQIPKINLHNHLNKFNSEINKKESEKLFNSLKDYGVAIIEDPRISKDSNDNFLDMMERYYEKRGVQFELDKNNISKDLFPEKGFQMGVTPEYFEKARNHSERIKNYKGENKPVSPLIPELDPKWRYGWGIGGKDFKMDVAPDQHIPEDFPEFEKSMNGLGNKMLNTCISVSEMWGIHIFNDKNKIADMMKKGPHLLAPTGSNLNKFNKLNTVLAGFHYDLSYLTIHGKSRYPGLYIWLKNGKRIPVKVPDGCLLIQAAKMLEIISGGVIFAGFHEVIVDENTIKKIELSKKENKSLWRVSSTLFSSINYDENLKTFPEFSKYDGYKEYQTISVQNHVKDELNSVNLFNYS